MQNTLLLRLVLAGVGLFLDEGLPILALREHGDEEGLDWVLEILLLGSLAVEVHHVSHHREVEVLVQARLVVQLLDGLHNESIALIMAMRKHKDHHAPDELLLLIFTQDFVRKDAFSEQGLNETLKVGVHLTLRHRCQTLVSLRDVVAGHELLVSVLVVLTHVAEACTRKEEIKLFVVSFFLLSLGGSL